MHLIPVAIGVQGIDKDSDHLLESIASDFIMQRGGGGTTTELPGELIDSFWYHVS